MKRNVGRAELRRIEREASIANARERAKLPRANRHLCTVIGIADITKLPRANRHLCSVISLADFIARDSKGLEEDDAGDAGFVKLLSFTYARGLADLLLLMAYTNPGKLRNLGEAICLALRDGGVDSVINRPIALELVNAYEQCEPRDGLRPTIKELRDKFKDLSDESDWPGDFSAVRTLRGLNLEVAPSKRGRPINARSLMKELGQKKQSRNQKKISTQKH